MGGFLLFMLTFFQILQLVAIKAFLFHSFLHFIHYDMEISLVVPFCRR